MIRHSHSQPLRIFVLHASDCVTDHMPHGDGLVATGFIRRLAERGHVVHVAAQSVALKQPMPPGVVLHPIHVPGHLGPAWRLAFMLSVRRLFARLSRDAPFDLVHQMNPVFTGLSLAVWGMHDTVVLGPFVPHWPEATGVAPSGWSARVRDSISRLQQRRAAALLLTTPAALSRVKTPANREASPHMFEVPHGIDNRVFQPRSCPPGKPSILFLANMWRRKGIFTLLDSLPAIRRVLPEATLTIAGRGSDEQLVRFAVERHPERDAIRVVGQVDRSEVPALIRSHAVYCLPSTGEPFGMSILEAMSCGVPVVTTNVAGPAFLIDELGGRLVPPDDPAALADALIEILQCEGLQGSMGSHNREVVERRFAWDRVLDSLEQAYYATLERQHAVQVPMATALPQTVDLPATTESA